MSLAYNSRFWAFCVWLGFNSSYYQINKVLRIYATLYHVEIFPGKNIPTDGKVMMKIKVASVYGTRCRLGFSLTDTVRFFCTPRFLVTITTTTTMTNKVARLLELFILTNAVIFRPNVSRYSRFQVDLLNTIIIETAYRSSSTGVHFMAYFFTEFQFIYSLISGRSFSVPGLGHPHRQYKSSENVTNIGLGGLLTARRSTKM